MNWHLNYTPTPSPVKISHADKILLIGSCFAENIGEKLLSNKFQTLVNPNGILFNPISIATALHSYIQQETRNQETKKPETGNGLYVSLDHHGSFSSTTKEDLEQKITSSRNEAHQFLKEAKFLIITFGSAFVYRHLKTNSIVANCHKLPQQEFKKELLTVATIVSEYRSLIAELKTFNPSLNSILTVSPVKYLRDGVVENNLSKSILIQSIHEIIASNNNCFYFPAYELVTDDLRDYRFYKEDMAHPNDQAIDYIWEKFSASYFSDTTQKLNKKIEDVAKAVLHRPLHQNTEMHLKFKKTYFQKCEELEREIPELNFTHEKRIFTT